MSKLFALAVPVLPGKEQEWKEWMAEVNGKYRNEFIASRKKFGVRERTFLQQTPMGAMVIVTLEGNDPAAAFTGFGQGTDEFTKFFVDSVKRLHGIDLSAPPPGPLPELIIDSNPQTVHAL
jgi:hypothetical protein